MFDDCFSDIQIHHTVPSLFIVKSVHSHYHVASSGLYLACAIQVLRTYMYI